MWQPIRTIIRFLRLENLLMIGLFMSLIRWLLLGPFYLETGVDFHLNPSEYALLYLDICVVALVGYWLNDWRDRPIDRINKPERLLVQYDIDRATFSVLLLAIMLVGGAMTLYLAVETSHLSKVWIYPAALVGVGWYAGYWKKQKLIGNLLVSALIAAMPWLIVVAEQPSMELLPTASIWETVGWYSALMFFSNYGREVSKDMEDIEGDRAETVRSIPILIGQSKSKQVVALALILIAICEVGFGLTFYDGSSFWAAMIAVLVPWSTCLWMLWRAVEKHEFAIVSRWFKWLMLAGMLQLLLKANWI